MPDTPEQTWYIKSGKTKVRVVGLNKRLLEEWRAALKGLRLSQNRAVTLLLLNPRLPDLVRQGKAAMPQIGRQEFFAWVPRDLVGARAAAATSAGIPRQRVLVYALFALSGRLKEELHAGIAA